MTKRTIQDSLDTLDKRWNNSKALYKYLKSNLIGRVVNGHLTGVITEEDLDRLYKEFTDAK